MWLVLDMKKIGNRYSYCLLGFLFLAMLYGVRSLKFLDQGADTYLLQWKCGVLTTGRPGKSHLTLFNVTVLEMWLLLASLNHKCDTSPWWKNDNMKCECSDDVRSRSPHGACSLMSVHVDFWLTSLSTPFPESSCLHSLCFVWEPFGLVYT